MSQQNFIFILVIFMTINILLLSFHYYKLTKAKRKKDKKLHKDLFMLFLSFTIISVFALLEAEQIYAYITTNYYTNNENNVIQDHDKAYIHFLNTGNSDCIIINVADKFVVIDGADNNDEESNVAYLKELQASSLLFIESTHPDADHSGGLDAIVDNFEIEAAFVGNGNADTKTYQSFIYALANRNLSPMVPLEESKVEIDEDTYFQFFNTRTVYEDVNDNSLITLFVNGNDTFLFTGDAGNEQISKFSNFYQNIDVLKVGHHGSVTSTSDELIKILNPTYGVILCGEGNKYGHPHQETLDILNKYNVITLRTDKDGTIIFESTGNGVKLLNE